MELSHVQLFWLLTPVTEEWYYRPALLDSLSIPRSSWSNNGDRGSKITNVNSEVFQVQTKERGGVNKNEEGLPEMDASHRKHLRAR